MYQNIFCDRKKELVYVWDDIRGFSQHNLGQFRYAYRPSSSGKYLSIYGETLELVQNFSEGSEDLYESDVPMDTRALVDLYQSSDDPSVGHRVAVIDIEVDSTGGFANKMEADEQITAIAVWDQMTNVYTCLVLDPDDRVSHESINIKMIHDGKLVVRGYTEETSLLSAFLNLWEEIAPTIVTGWNSTYFDMPYLYHRMKREMGYGACKRLSPVGACYFSTWSEKMVIGGISCLDYMDMMKLFPQKKEPSYSLNYIGKKFAGIEKITYEGSLNNLYRTDINRFIEYNVNDVQIVVELEYRKKYIDLARSICHAGHVPYEYWDTSSRYIEGAILMYLKRTTREIVQNKPSKGREEYENKIKDDVEGYSGAFVKHPIPGLYRWIYDLDLTSMYPSIVISLNISPETKAAVVARVLISETYREARMSELMAEYPELPEKRKKEFENANNVSSKDAPSLYAKQNINKFNIDYHVRDKIDEYVIGEDTYSRDEFNQFVKDNKYTLSSNGVMYRTDKTGVIPSILIDWFNMRKEYRKKAKAAFKRGDMVEYAYYDQRQYTIKILLNSVYGVLGLPVFRFYDRDNAEAVTTTGVSIIKAAGDAINAYYKSILGDDDKDYVIYSDTDSCFASVLPLLDIKCPGVDRNDVKAMSEATLAITGEVQAFVNKFFDLLADRFFNLTDPKFELERNGEVVKTTHRFEAKQELISKTAFWLAKKRYAQLIINKEGKMLDEPELEVKGIDVVRTSFPAKFRTYLEDFLLMILRGEKTQQQIDEDIINFKRGMKDLSAVDLAKNTSVNFISKDGKHNYNEKGRKPFHSPKGAPAQVKAALFYNDMLKHLNLDKMVEPIYNSQKIKWVYLIQNKYGIECIAMKADGTDPKDVMKFIDKYIDRTALYEKELKSKIEDFYNVLGWHYPTESSMLASQFFDF